jgi:hypothetical protein
MKYILPLEKEREKYHFEISNDGKELKKSNIIPVVNDNKQDLQNGVVYVESPFQKDEYFDITEFNQKSQETWQGILQEFATKIGAKKIIITSVAEKEDSKKTSSNKEKEFITSGEYKVVEANASIKNSNNSQENASISLKSLLLLEVELQGEKDSKEEVEKWIKDKKINIKDNVIFGILFDRFNKDDLKTFKITKSFEQMITGIHDVNNTLSAIANIKSPLFSVNMQTSLNSAIKEEFRKYEKMEFKIEIYF